MLHSNWFTLITFTSANVSFSDMIPGDNGNIKEVLLIASFIDYLVIYLIYCCVVVFCLYNETALYNNNIVCSGKKTQETKLMWPVMPPLHMQSVTKSNVPARKQVHSIKSKGLLQEDDRNCQENINRRPMKSQLNDEKNGQSRCFKSPKRQMCNDKEHPSTVKKVCPGRNCQGTQFMQPVKSEYRRLCKEQTCQSTRCYKKHSDPKKRQKMQYKVKSN